MRWKRGLFFLFFVFSVGKIQASDVRILAVFPNPVGNDSGEWIAVENMREATVAAGLYWLRDTVGSTKTASLSAFQPSERKTIHASQSGITLNNTGESVELLSGGVVVDTTPTLIATREGMVFFRSENTWIEITLDEYFERLTTEYLVPGVSRESEQDEQEDSREGPELFLPSVTRQISKPEIENRVISRKLPKFLPAATVATPSSFSWPTPPKPWYEQEMDVFLEWKRKAIFGSLSLMFGGICLLLVASPPVLRFWQWLRGEIFL